MKVVIVGGGYAGVTCALRLARRARRLGAACDITVVNPTDRFVERIRLHQAVAGQRLPARDLRRLLARAGVRLAVGHAERIDLGASTVRLTPTASGGEAELLHWDRLVLAMGSTIGVTRTISSALGVDRETHAPLAERLRSLAPGAAVTVVGTGLTGLETATEIKEARPDLHVRLVGRADVGADWSPAARKHLLASLARLGVELQEGVEAARQRGDDLITSAGPLRSDLTIMAAGFAWPALARASNLAVTPAGQVSVDPRLRSLVDARVYAAGDIAAPARQPGGALTLGCKSAEPMGAFVADDIARELSGAPPLPFDYATAMFCVSLGRRNGLIQLASSTGALTGPVLTGRTAAAVKEMICKATWWALELEARGVPAVVWKRTGRAPGALAGDVAGALEA